jgi:hypothetical protein
VLAVYNRGHYRVASGELALCGALAVAAVSNGCPEGCLDGLPCDDPATAGHATHQSVIPSARLFTLIIGHGKELL